MCGIVGYIKPDGVVNRDEFIKMRDTLIHRGPDAAGALYFENGSIALGHRRLAFLDLSSAGNQPMSNEDESTWIVLNGEIYNYKELRALLIAKGHVFKTQTDTEVILHGYEEWGTSVLSKLKGMFAFGLIDLNQKKLFLVRDRFGIKPLYYTHVNGQFIFASELKAILACSSVKREVDMSSFTDYFVYRYIPSPKTIWKNIAKLPPANFLIYDYQNQKIHQEEYWELSLKDTNQNNIDLIKYVDVALKKSISIHAQSEVPIGSFLSGGYDSTAILYYLTTIGYKPETFTVGFQNWENSEDQFAKIVADHFHVPNTSIVVEPDKFSLLQKMATVFDEPIADISIVPTWLVSQLAVKKVKAVMSGEGADELFAGYNWQKQFITEANTPQTKIDKLIAFFVGNKMKHTLSFYSASMAMGKFDKSELQQLLEPSYHQYIANDTDWFYRKNIDITLSPLKRIQKLDIKCFMGELVLTKIDRASMAHSLEVRVPFLEHTLFERILAHSEGSYYKGESTKYLLYENIKNTVPDIILKRPKQGFVGPDNYYMSMRLYKEVLDKSTLIKGGIISKEYYIQLLSHKAHWKLWKLLIMELWYREWVVKC